MKLQQLIAEKKIEWFRRYVWLPSKWVFTPVALICISYVVYLSWHDIAALWRGANKGFLAIAALLLAAVHCLLPCAAFAILRSIGERIDYRGLLEIHLRRLPARYLPGGIWHTVGRAVDMHTRGVSSSSVGWFVALENALSVTTAFALGGILLVSAGVLAKSVLWVSIAVAIAAVGFLAFAPYLARKFLPSIAYKPTTTQWIGCCVCFGLVWLVQSAAFVIYSMAMLIDPAAIRVAHTAGVYLFSWAIGFLAFFAPQGIGVFETVAVFLSELPLLPAAIATIAGFRLCVLVVDLCLGASVHFLGLRGVKPTMGVR